jgi:photoactive yellow protein
VRIGWEQAVEIVRAPATADPPPHRDRQTGPEGVGVAVAGFDDVDLLSELESAPDTVLDEVDFGVIVMDRAGVVVFYNHNESGRSGLGADRVLGHNFFIEIGPCTNNYLIAERFHTEPDLDATLDYVFTFRMRPTPVRLRLLAAAGSARQYLLVQNR